MKDIRSQKILRTSSLREAIEKLNSSGKQCLMVVDSGDRLVGLITDGDIRRNLLRGCDLSAPVEGIMNQNPISVSQETSSFQALNLMRRYQIFHLPIVNADGRVVGLHVHKDLFFPDQDATVLIMAGGLGTRLHPLTTDCPKPMLNVGGKPLLESTIQRLREQGFVNIYLSVHYLSHMIRDYFGYGENFGVKIEYLEEETPSGTAGALRNLPDTVKGPILVMNGDIITTMSFSHLLDYHLNEGNGATICVRQHRYRCPYGVLETDAVTGNLVSLKEKPVYEFMVSAGIYMLDAGLLPGILSPEGVLDMTSVLECLQEKTAVKTYPINDYWIDIGRLEDLQAARTLMGAVDRCRCPRAG